MMKRFLAIVLSVVMLVSTLPIVALAGQEHQHSFDQGTKENGVSYTYCDEEIGARVLSLPTRPYPESSHEYANDADASYSYSVPNASNLSLDFSSLTRTEAGYDFIYIYDGRSKLLGKYSGTDLAGKTVEVAGSSVKVRITSDRSKTFYGFSIDRITATIEGVAYAMPNNPMESSHSYGNNESKTYTFAYPNANGYSFTFSKMCQTEKDFDFVTVLDENGKEIGSYSGTEMAGRSFDIEGESFSIRLTSDRSKTYYGFSLDSLSTRLNGATELEKNREYSYTVPSLLYPESSHNYSDNENESYGFSYQGASSLELTFSNKTLTEESYDFISIFDTQGKLVGKYSGYALGGRTIVINGSGFKIQLTSDRSKTYYGFSLDSVVANMSANSFEHEASFSSNRYSYNMPATAHSYANFANESYSYTDCKASSLSVKFSSLCETEKDYDIISIFDGEGLLVGRYSGNELAGKIIKIDSPSFRVDFVSDRSKVFYGYSIDYIEATYENDEAVYDYSAFPESNHNYENYANQVYHYVARSPFANSLVAHFSKDCMLENGYDFVSIYDDEDGLVGRYTGTELANRDVAVKGNSFTVVLETDRSADYYGFKIDYILEGTDTDYYIENEDDHDYVLVKTIDRSFYSQGLDCYYCTICGDTYTQETDAFVSANSLDYQLHYTEISYDGDPHYPTVFITDKKGNKLVRGADFQLEYSGDGVEVGRYDVRVVFLNENIIGEKTLSFDVVPRRLASFALTPLLGGMIVTWTPDKSQYSGYEIQYSTSSQLENAGVIDVPDPSAKEKRVSPMVKGQTYYVRLRAYVITEKGEKIYSYFSPTKSVYTEGCLYLNDTAANMSIWYDNVTREVFGYSYQGRPLEAYIITPKSGYYTKTYYMNFAIHGFEGESYRDGRFLTAEANRLVQYYAENPEKLLNMRLIIIPCLNPDGVIAGVNELYTGNNAFGRNAANHVDLNRDFNTFAGYESRAIRSLMAQYRPSMLSDFHGWLDTTIGTPAMVDIYSDELALSHKQPNSYGETKGYLMGYTYSYYNIPSCLVEFKNSNINHKWVCDAVNRVIRYYNV